MSLFDFLFKDKVLMVVHDGNFHPDDVFACAVISIWVKKQNKILKILRTRDENLIKKADIVADVGMIYDANTNRFDHHQKGGAGQRQNDIPYASFGLIWKKYGEIICDSKDIADLIDFKLIMPIDAKDNGININNDSNLVDDYPITNFISNLNNTWQESKKESYKNFLDAVSCAEKIIEREMAVQKALFEGEIYTNNLIKDQNNPAILILDKEVDWKIAVLKNKNVKCVVYPRENNKEWVFQSARDDLTKFDSDRVRLPDNWWGLRFNELDRVSGIKDTIFCINKGWFAVAHTKEAILKMADNALHNKLF